MKKGPDSVNSSVDHRGSLAANSGCRPNVSSSFLGSVSAFVLVLKLILDGFHIGFSGILFETLAFLVREFNFLLDTDQVTYGMSALNKNFGEIISKLMWNFVEIFFKSMNVLETTRGNGFVTLHRVVNVVDCT